MIEIETIFQKPPLSETWVFVDDFEIPNRAMSFGDGLFETMVWDKSQIRFFDKHLQRLVAGMNVLGLDSEQVNGLALSEFLNSKFPEERMRVRWNVFRAGKGKYTPETSQVFQTLQISRFSSAPPAKLKVDVSLKIQLFPTIWSAFKTLNALPYVLANQERRERELDEIILLDSRGYISESGASNIFWMKGGVVFTPALSCSCINGVSRQVILSYLDQKKITFKEGEFLPSELDDADQVFVSNCTGISYLGSFRFIEYSTEPIKYFTDLFE
jgi:4-amino-4-deoxychorismate lyase